ncbi:MAG TPA: SDR family NAD(P)-dependent oxidoreductase, partial [Acidimicrobiales bacterium]|nr:SDR family NAD(P)-dependent oxidoreductase [Acidimicrobiales bacterium]
MELAGKTAVIMGGASGIGLATAKKLAQSGARLVLGDIEGETLASVVEAFHADNIPAIGLVTDVTKEE